MLWETDLPNQLNDDYIIKEDNKIYSFETHCPTLDSAKSTVPVNVNDDVTESKNNALKIDNKRANFKICDLVRSNRYFIINIPVFVLCFFISVVVMAKNNLFEPRKNILLNVFVLFNVGLYHVCSSLSLMIAHHPTISSVFQHY